MAAFIDHICSFSSNAVDSNSFSLSLCRTLLSSFFTPFSVRSLSVPLTDLVVTLSVGGFHAYILLKNESKSDCSVVVLFFFDVDPTASEAVLRLRGTAFLKFEGVETRAPGSETCSLGLETCDPDGLTRTLG